MDYSLSVSDDNRFYRVREQCLDAEVRDGVAYSRWLPWPDVELKTWLVADETCHLRIHKITTPRKLWTIESGFPVGYTVRASLHTKADSPNGPVVRTPNGSSSLRNLLGERKNEPQKLGSNSSLLTSLTAMPLLCSAHEPRTHWLACIVSGSAEPQDTFSQFSDFTVTANDDTCCILRNGEPWWLTHGDGCGDRPRKHVAQN